MANSIEQALKNNSDGFYIGNRLVLPFRCQIIKLIFDGEVIVDFKADDDIRIAQDPQNTSFYFKQVNDLSRRASSYKNIKLIASDWEAEICAAKHFKLILDIEEQHVVKIKESGEDDPMFFE